MHSTNIAKESIRQAHHPKPKSLKSSLEPFYQVKIKPAGIVVAHEISKQLPNHRMNLTREMRILDSTAKHITCLALGTRPRGQKAKSCCHKVLGSTSKPQSSCRVFQALSVLGFILTCFPHLAAPMRAWPKCCRPQTVRKKAPKFQHLSLESFTTARCYTCPTS